MPRSNEVEERLRAATGFAFHVTEQTKTQGIEFSVRLSDLPRLHGFSIDVLVGWRTLTAVFHPDTFAADLLRAMSDSSEEKRVSFSHLAGSLVASGLTIAFRLDGQDHDPSRPEQWPTAWETLALSVETRPHDIDRGAVSEEVADVALAASSLVLSLLPLQEEEPGETSTVGDLEGRRTEVATSRYERSPANRAACIALKGTRCSACGLLLEDRYGSLARGYIEVHHSTPVSELANSPVDIARDLHPLCPNCHAMVHRENPPIEVARLRAILEDRTSDLA